MKGCWWVQSTVYGLKLNRRADLEAGILIDSLWVLRASERSAVDVYLNGGKEAEFIPDGVAYTALEPALSSILPSYSSGSALPAGRNCRSMKPNCS